MILGRHGGVHERRRQRCASSTLLRNPVAARAS
jgi:hypothetical protein